MAYNDPTKRNALADITSARQQMKAIKGVLARLERQGKQGILVGENGPEVFVPEEEGQILPNPAPMSKKAGALERAATKEGVPHAVGGASIVDDFISGAADRVVDDWESDKKDFEEVGNDLYEIGGRFGGTAQASQGAIDPGESESAPSSLATEPAIKPPLSQAALDNAADITNGSNLAVPSLGIPAETPYGGLKAQINRSGVSNEPGKFDGKASINGKNLSLADRMFNRDQMQMQQDGDKSRIAAIEAAANPETRAEYQPGYLERQQALQTLDYNTSGGKYAGGGLTADNTPLQRSTDGSNMKQNVLNAEINKTNAEKQGIINKGRLEAAMNSDTTDAFNKRSDAELGARTAQANALETSGLAKATALRDKGLMEQDRWGKEMGFKGTDAFNKRYDSSLKSLRELRPDLTDNDALHFETLGAMQGRFAYGPNGEPGIGVGDQHVPFRGTEEARKWFKWYEGQNKNKA